MKKLGIPVLVLTIAALYFLVTGLREKPYTSHDFVPVYAGVRCLLHGCNPYDATRMSFDYTQSGGDDPRYRNGAWWTSTPPVYPPSVFVALSPLGLVRYPAAKSIWLFLNAGLFLAALAFVLHSCPPQERWLSSLLGASFLLEGGALLQKGQPACLAVALLVISFILYSTRRHMLLASCLLCMSLAVKPQIGGLVALYLLFDKSKRRYVLSAMTGAIAILLLGAVILQQNPASESWLADLRTNLALSALPGHINDPASTASTEINLQSADVVAFSDPRIAGIVTDALLLLFGSAWILAAYRYRGMPQTRPLLLSALLVFSMLAVYHRQYDASLLILTLPVILLVYGKRHRLGLLLGAVTVYACTPVQNHANGWLSNHDPALRQNILEHNLSFLLVLRQQNLAFILLFCLYLTAIFATRVAVRTGRERAPILSPSNA